MSVKVQRSSRLRFGRLLDLDGVEHWEVLDLPTIPERADDLNYMVTSRDRIDLLAYRFYDDPVLWWVIAAANNMEILPTDLVAGSTIRIPSPTYVRGALFSAAKGGR